jgi:hypothetical protein
MPLPAWLVAESAEQIHEGCQLDSNSAEDKEGSLWAVLQSALEEAYIFSTAAEVGGRVVA